MQVLRPTPFLHFYLRVLDLVLATARAAQKVSVSSLPLCVLSLPPLPLLHTPSQRISAELEACVHSAPPALLPRIPTLLSMPGFKSSWKVQSLEGASGSKPSVLLFSQLISQACEQWAEIRSNQMSALQAFAVGSFSPGSHHNIWKWREVMWFHRLLLILSGVDTKFNCHSLPFVDVLFGLCVCLWAYTLI